MTTLLRRFIGTLGLVLITCTGMASAAPMNLVLGDGTEVSMRVFPASGDTLLLWFACDEGQGTWEAKSAAKLTARQIETWLPDMLGAHFLPSAPSSMESIPEREIAELIEHAVKTSGKRVYLIGAGRGALTVLLGARAWQQGKSHATQHALGGVVLFYPELYAAPPTPGAEPEYHPVVKATHLPLVVMQGERSPGRWWLNHLKQALEQGGSKVETRLLPGVRGYFFVRQDQTPEETAMAEKLPTLILDALTQLTTLRGDAP